MPRQLRIEYPGAIYQDDGDRTRFLQTLGEVCGKTDWQIDAYCLMRNHFRVVLDHPGDNLVATP